MRDMIAVSSRKLQEAIAKGRQNSDDNHGAMVMVTELDVGTGLEFIDLEASTFLHINISIYSTLSEILVAPRRFSTLRRVINE